VQLNDALTETYRLKSVLFHIAERQTSADQALVGDSSSLTIKPYQLKPW
jgi:hypothetical protein